MLCQSASPVLHGPIAGGAHCLGTRYVSSHITSRLCRIRLCAALLAAPTWHDRSAALAVRLQWYLQLLCATCVAVGNGVQVLSPGERDGCLVYFQSHSTAFVLMD